eukprot:NODE_5705_length_557_cov_107.584646_g4968_i0.p1 GENE.NODE_5705_length_557_cov_107.584646_g4968_i0~~NODE_5705_length_557_cov_107.584646_g4968_i0.p1  ORF type:complete len:86 (+),score=11.53 NODE_5705_length_557_cov_107.584646_g4968_i0:34-258(+)
MKVDMYASEWIMTLFSSVMPIEQMCLFYNHFFERRWIFFYEIVLSILKFLEEDLLAEDELLMILTQIKTSTGPA